MAPNLNPVTVKPTQAVSEFAQTLSLIPRVSPTAKSASRPRPPSPLGERGQRRTVGPFVSVAMDLPSRGDYRKGAGCPPAPFRFSRGCLRAELTRLTEESPVPADVLPDEDLHVGLVELMVGQERVGLREARVVDRVEVRGQSGAGGFARLERLDVH